MAAVRLGRVTTSDLKTLLLNGKGSGGLGTGAITYMHLLIDERMSDELAKPFQGNTHTKRSHELESIARLLYRYMTGAPQPSVGALSSTTMWATRPIA